MDVIKAWEKSFSAVQISGYDIQRIRQMNVHLFIKTFKIFGFWTRVQNEREDTRPQALELGLSHCFPAFGGSGQGL
jgi:hypothetical protein